MNRVISFEEIHGALKNPPSLNPRPDFPKIRALREFIYNVLKHVSCPQSLIHGWAGLAMDPQMYALIEPNPFVMPPDPGDLPNYGGMQFPSTVALKTADRMFDMATNYFTSYLNINRALFRMLDDSIDNNFKVSNDPNLKGWNPTMSVQMILTQLETAYGKPTGTTIWENDKLFRSAFGAHEVPEALFLRLERCQEVAILGNNPYSQTQLVTCAVQLLLQSGIFPMKEFEDWEREASKTWTDLKKFVQAAYQRKLTVLNLRATSGTAGYVNQNMFHLLEDDGDYIDDAESVSTVNTVTQQEANATINSGVTAPSTITADVLTAINTLAANQATIVQQMAAFSLSGSRPAHQAAAPAVHVPYMQQQSTTPYVPPQGPPLQVPPVPAVHVPVLASYNQSGGYGGGYTQGRGGRNSGYGGRSAGYRRNGRGRNNRTGYGAYQGRGGAIVPYTGAAHAYPQVGGPPPRINPPHSNVTKRFNNWNACYSCGFDVADWHMSHTCNNRKPSHDESYTRANAQMFLNRGDPHVCTAGIHKTQLPQMGPRF